MPPTDSIATPTLRPMGLRERKKAQTRAAIQRHALRLFRETGYPATTMEQIAAAADVSPSTLYRYFPTKEDLILTDDYDPLLAAAFRLQPRDMSPLDAFRASIHEVLDMAPEADREEVFERTRMAFAIPEVRAKALDHMLETSDMITGLFAERVGRPADDYASRIMAGAVMGAILAAQQQWAAHPDSDIFELIDSALRILDQGSAAIEA